MSYDDGLYAAIRRVLPEGDPLQVVYGEGYLRGDVLRDEIERRDAAENAEDG